MHRIGTVLAAGALAALLVVGSGGRVFAGEPVIGGELGAAVPLSQFQKSASLGGSASVYGGYHFQLNDTVGLSLLGQPEFSFFESDHPINPNSGFRSSPDAVIIMGLNAGPRLTLGDPQAYVFVDGRGGYYRELMGPLNEDGPGYAVGGGAGFELAKGTSLILFGRYNEAFMRAKRASNENLRFVTAGFGVEHRFLAPEPVKAAPPPPPPPPPPPAPVKKKIILRGVNFDFDKSNIRADARPVLDEAIDTLKEAGDVSIAVQGHTDSVGSDAYNQGLSMRRANAVAGYLADGGISRSRMEVEGFGESQPVASNDTDDGRAQNRRVELKVVGQ